MGEKRDTEAKREFLNSTATIRNIHFMFRSKELQHLSQLTYLCNVEREQLIEVSRRNCIIQSEKELGWRKGHYLIVGSFSQVILSSVLPNLIITFSSPTTTHTNK